MPEQEHVELQNIINDKEARIEELEEQIKAHECTINTLTQQHHSLVNELKKKIDETKKEIDETKKEMRKMEKKKNDLEKEVKKLKGWNSAKDSQYNKLEKKLENDKISHANEMTQLRQVNSRDIEKANNKIKELEKKLEKDIGRIQLRNEDLKKEKASLQEENNNLSKLSKNVPNPLENSYLCIGQLCSDLQANMYKYVLPDDYSDKVYTYKFREIEEDIDTIVDNEEQQEALARFDDLKKEIKWEKRVGRAINSLQKERNQRAHPKIFSVAAAQEAAKELNKEGELEGKIYSYMIVLRIIKMWEKTCELLEQNNQ